MHTILDYGKSGLKLEVSKLDATILSPKFLPGLADEEAAFNEAINNPIGCAPLKEIIGSNETVAIVIPDITRALPNERLLTWLFEELSHLPAENYTIISGTGTHRENTDEEWEYMVGRRIYRN